MTENNSGMKWRIVFEEPIEFYDLNVDYLDCMYFNQMGSMLKLYLENETVNVDTDNIQHKINMDAMRDTWNNKTCSGIRGKDCVDSADVLLEVDGSRKILCDECYLVLYQGSEETNLLLDQEDLGV